MNHKTLLAALIASSILPASVGAQTDAQEAARAEASELLEQGFEAYLAKDYQAAVRAFAQSYASYPSALTLHNLSKSYQKAGELDAALSAAKRAATEPSDPLNPQLATKNAELLVELQAALDAREAARYEDKRVTWASYAGGGAVVGGGVALVVAFGYFGRYARSELDAFSYDTRAEYELQRQRIERAQSYGRVTMSVGAGLIAVGAGLLAYDLLTVEQVLREQEDQGLTLSVGAGPQGFSVMGRW